MSETKPYYTRSLDDFPDDVIARARQGERGWYAVLNSPNNIHGRSMPDFSSFGDTREEAIARCAKVMRDDDKGIGKYAPHSCFRGYALHWILCAHWAHRMGEEVDALGSWIPDR
jgi:hypothetical protein